MKIRKHNSNKSFRISFQTRTFSVVVKNKGNVGGWEKTERREVLSPVQFAQAEGVSEGAVRTGFLFGRDRGNTLILSIQST